MVASDIPAHREAASYTAGEGVTFVSPEGSPLEVADAIAQAATGPAPVIARSLPSWDDALDATLAVYEQILDEPVAGGMRADPLGNLGVVTGGRSGA